MVFLSGWGMVGGDVAVLARYLLNDRRRSFLDVL